MNIRLHCLWGSRLRGVSGTWGVKKKSSTSISRTQCQELIYFPQRSLLIHFRGSAPQSALLHTSDAFRTVRHGSWLQAAPSSRKNWKSAWVVSPSSAASVRPDRVSARQAVPMGSTDVLEAGSSAEPGLNDGWCFTAITEVWGWEPSHGSLETCGEILKLF